MQLSGHSIRRAADGCAAVEAASVADPLDNDTSGEDDAAERSRLENVPMGITSAPSEYTRRLWYDTVNNYPPALQCSCEAFGVDRIMLGTDFPYNAFLPDDVKIAQVDVRPEHLGRRSKLDLAIWGDVKQTLRCLTPRLRQKQDRSFLDRMLRKHADALEGVVKAYTRKGYLRALRNSDVFRTREGLRFARRLGSSDTHRMIAYEWLPGRMLAEICLDLEIDWDAVTATGVALAALHSQPADGLERWTREDEKTYLMSLAREVGFLCPSLAARADALVRSARWLGADRLRLFTSALCAAFTRATCTT